MPSAIPKPARLVSLDVFRGITIAGMILVNNPGSGDIYGPLRHAEWNGCTATDLVFPFFLFIVGVAIAYSLSRRATDSNHRRALTRHIVRRTLIIFGLGMFLNGFPFTPMDSVRIPGVLQRIAVVYLIVSIIYLRTGLRGQAALAVFFIALYWALLKFVPVPGYGAGVLEREGNLVAYVDNLLMAGHLYKPAWDPEGIVSTIPAISTALMGVLAGRWLRSSVSPGGKILGLLAGGAVCAGAGMILDNRFPINKNLWSSSYVLLSGGLAAMFLGGCYWLVDVWRGQRVARVATLGFVVFGMNAIVSYVGSSAGYLLMNLEIKDDSIKSLLTGAYASLAGPPGGSALFALTYVLLWLGIMSIFYRKKIFIKI